MSWKFSRVSHSLSVTSRKSSESELKYILLIICMKIDILAEKFYITKQRLAGHDQQQGRQQFAPHQRTSLKSVWVAVSFSDSESRPTLLLLVTNSDSLFCDENRKVVIYDVYIYNLNTESWQNLIISPEKSLWILPQSNTVSGYLSEILLEFTSTVRKFSGSLPEFSHGIRYFNREHTKICLQRLENFVSFSESSSESGKIFFELPRACRWCLESYWSSWISSASSGSCVRDFMSFHRKIFQYPLGIWSLSIKFPGACRNLLPVSFKNLLESIHSVRKVF